MTNLKTFVEQELKLDGDFCTIRNKMLDTIKSTYNHYAEKVQNVTCTYKDIYERARLSVFKETDFIDSYRSDVCKDALRVINACVLHGVCYESVEVPDIFDNARRVLEVCLPNIAYMCTCSEDFDEEQGIIWSNTTIWQYEDMDEDSDVVRYANYLLELKQKMMNWLVQYYMEHPLKCVEEEYHLTTDSYDWLIFFNYASHTLLRVILGLHDSSSFKLSPRSPHERYAVRYVLEQFKDELGVQIYFDSTLDKRAADLYSDCFRLLKFSPVAKENYTKAILNLSGKDNFFESVKKLEAVEETYLITTEDMTEFFKSLSNTKAFNTKL